MIEPSMRARFSWNIFIFSFCFLFSGVLLGSTAVTVHAADETYYAPQLEVPIPGLDFTKYAIVRTKDGIQVPFLGAYVGAVYKYLIAISIIAAAVMIVYGGFKYILGATLTQVASGKDTVVDAVIGLILVFASYTLLYTVGGSSVVTFKPLEVKVIDPIYQSHVDHMDGVPLEQMNAWDKPEPPPGSPAQPGQPAQPGSNTAGIGKNCATSFAYKFPPKKCNGEAACRALFCDQKDYTLEGVPAASQMVGFDAFPPTVGEQINQKGITFLPPAACFNKAGCDATKYLTTILLGPNAPVLNQYRMKGGMIFRPEVRDALIAAGAAAKAKGYFLVIGDGTRTMEVQATNWCKRIEETGGPGGMATPGGSPHQLGVGVDIALFKLMDNKVVQLTVGGQLCTQVTQTQLLGVENLRTLESVMASAGFKHMCGEVWHFDYQGVYATDCDECEFPGHMQKRIDADKSCAPK